MSTVQAGGDGVMVWGICSITLRIQAVLEAKGDPAECRLHCMLYPYTHRTHI